MIVLSGKTIITGGVLLSLATAFGVAVSHRFADPTAAARQRAQDIGAEFLGTEEVVFQDKATNCGPAALKMILEHAGKYLSLQDLEQWAGEPTKTWSMMDMKNVAERLGAQAQGWTLRFEDLRRINLPAILFVEGRHYVVVDSTTKENVAYLRDPAGGRVRVSRRTLERMWKGESLLFEAPAQQTFKRK